MFDASVIGGGPAGLSAGMTLGRALRETLVLDAGKWRNGRSPGGQSGRILNFGTRTDADDLELADRYPAAEVVGIDISAEMVKEVKKGMGSYQPRLVGTFKEVPNEAEHPGLIAEQADPVMNSNQLRSSERSRECG